jgi:dolichol-phosphate mannosyltransferase
MTPELTVIVFAFNEEENVAPILDELRAFLRANVPSSEIVFVDDGSTDGTHDAATRALAGFPGTTIRHSKNSGIGRAIKSGTRAARGRFVTFMPADGQIAPDAIRTLLAARREHDADVVLSVYDHRDDGWHRTMLSAGVRALIFVVHGVVLHSDGPYLFRRTLFVPEQLAPDSFFLNFEFAIRALRAGLVVRTITIACRPRRAGASKSTGPSRIVGVAEDLARLRLRRLRAATARLVGGPLDP